MGLSREQSRATLNLATNQALGHDRRPESCLASVVMMLMLDRDK